MKRKLKYFKESKKSTVIVYLILRLLVILCLIRQLILGHYDSAFFCVLSLILLFLPAFVQEKFKITLPSILEITIYLFIFSAEILGEVYEFYLAFPYWDIILHTINGFLCAAIGLSLIDLINNNSDKFKLSPLYLSIVAFCFSMTIGIIWEFGEYSVDKMFLSDSQKDTIITTVASINLGNDTKTEVIKNIDKTVLYDKEGEVLQVIEGGYLDIGLNDTMEDLFVNLIGALVYCVLGYFYIKNRNNKNVASKFLITKNES